jgi:hypothetical protein
MLVNCPKCDFSQPKETYCAKCGVEMDAFKPEKTSLIKSTIKNPVVHIVVFLAAVYFGYSTYKSKSNSNTDTDTYSLSRSAPPSQNRKPSNSVAQPSQDANVPTANNIAPTTASVKNMVPGAPPPPPQQTLNSELNNVRTPSSSDAEPPTAPVPHTQGPWTLQARYIELSSQAYQQWLTEAQALGAYEEMGDFNMGKLIKAKKNFSKTIDTSTKVYTDLKSNKVFTGNLNAEAGSDLTISFKFILGQDTNGAFQVDVDLNEEDASGAYKKQFTSLIEIKPTELLFIRSVVPHNPGKTETSDSEFLIIFDFQPSH